MEIRAIGMPEPGLAGFSLDLLFDPSVMRVRSVTAGDGPWAGVTVNVLNDNGEVRVSGASGMGVPGASTLVLLLVEAVGAMGEQSEVRVLIQRLAASDQRAIIAEAGCGKLRVR